MRDAGAEGLLHRLHHERSFVDEKSYAHGWQLELEVVMERCLIFLQICDHDLSLQMAVVLWEIRVTFRLPLLQQFRTDDGRIIEAVEISDIPVRSKQMLSREYLGC